MKDPFSFVSLIFDISLNCITVATLSTQSYHCCRALRSVNSLLPSPSFLCTAVVTNHLHMIVFKTAREAVVASDKVNARRGPRYGLYAAETVFGEVASMTTLADGVPLVLNKHYHRLVPDPDGASEKSALFCLTLTLCPNANEDAPYFEYHRFV